MKLRNWQSECVKKALQNFKLGNEHFLCLATPGAGKTLMASELTKELFGLGLIDYVLCFSPSVVVSKDFQISLESHTSMRFDGLVGSKGFSFTYQTMLSLSEKIWDLLNSDRVFVIFDEIHHCSGSESDQANAWGNQILKKIQGRAAYTLALTGTPWRSDKTPISLAKYCDANRVICDYNYGLLEAVRDEVCRIPRIVITDNNRITVNDGGQLDLYEGFSSLLNESNCRYIQLIEDAEVIRYIIRQANSKLIDIRKLNPNAGGLIVAASVKHANAILNILKNDFDQNAVIATYYENRPSQVIQDFKYGSQEWIVSVGMISEGTNIPRLQVCCHLSRIKTELHFRQVLGRILRNDGSQLKEAFLYIPAESKLIEYGKRVAEDIPSDHNILSFEVVACDKGLSGSNKIGNEVKYGAGDFDMSLDPYAGVTDISENSHSPLSKSYDATINISGQFKSDVLALSMNQF